MDDARAIEHLLYRYAEHMDDGDFAAIGALFERGRIVAPALGQVYAGAEAVRALYEASARRYADGTPHTQHLVSNVRIEIDADGAGARAWSRYTVFQAVERLPLQAIIAGRYEDRFARDAAGWHFVERILRTDLIGEIGYHLLYELPR